jgi:sensor histidine kinase regulating citrate/malate metabolism
MGSKKVGMMITLLVVVFALIGFLLVTKYDTNINLNLQDDDLDVQRNVSQNPVLKEIYSEQEKPLVKKNIVTDRFTTKIDADGVLVVVKDGNAYNVERGIVLVDDTMIKRTDSEVVVDYMDSDGRRIITS